MGDTGEKPARAAKSADPDRLPRLPIRSRRYGVGKEIGGAVYLHRRYEQLLGLPVQEAKARLPPDFDYTVVKYHTRRGSVSFVFSPDFDVAPEPTVGDAWIVGADGSTHYCRAAADPYVYHHKWLFVADDYPGFDVAESKDRSLEWSALAPPVHRARIGRRSYWEGEVLSRLNATHDVPAVVVRP